MTNQPHRRKLTDHLRDWDADQLAALLVRRPDLVRPKPPADIAELADRAQQRNSVAAAIRGITLPQQLLLQVVLCYPPATPLVEIHAALPDGVTPADVEPVFTGLEEAALVWRHGDRVHCPGMVRQQCPSGLGPTLDVLLRDQRAEYLQYVLDRVRNELSTQRGLELPPPTRPFGRSPRKAELVDELMAVLCTPGAVTTLVNAAPEKAVEMAVWMSIYHPVIEVQQGLYFAPDRAGRHGDDPAYWLFERGLLLPTKEFGVAAQPREVTLALRGGRPVADLALACPPLVTATADRSRADGNGAARALLTMDRLADLLERWAAQPAKELKAGGLGVTVMKQVAAELETDVEEAARLVELLYLAGLIRSTVVTSGRGRNTTYDQVVSPTDVAAGWSTQPPVRRWQQLATAWLRAQVWPSGTGRRDPEGRAVAVIGGFTAPETSERRHQALDALTGLAADEVTTPQALADVLMWHQPLPWLVTGADDGPTAVAWIWVEAELLGVVADGGLTTAGRALLARDHDGAEAAFEAALPPPVSRFTLQADLTATVVGALERDVLIELRLVADLESSGVASTFRFSDASVRRALDAGHDAAAILAFLEAHSTKGVPRPLSYLVTDVARRYGQLQVGSALSFVTSDDPATLADACSHRKTKKLGLRLLAPTVAVSRLAPAKVMAGLRDAGFLPAEDGVDLATIALTAAATAASGASPVVDLPERFPAQGPRRGTAAPLHPNEAAALALTIISERRPSSNPAKGGGGLGEQLELISGPGMLRYLDGEARDEDLDDDDDLDDEVLDAVEDLRALEDLFAIAAARGEALALVGTNEVGEEQEPILLMVTEWANGYVTGMDLRDGSTTTIHVLDIAAAMSLGAVSGLDLAPRRGNGRRRR